jgi:hypothetical protein
MGFGAASNQTNFYRTGSSQADIAGINVDFYEYPVSLPDDIGLLSDKFCFAVSKLLFNVCFQFIKSHILSFRTDFIPDVSHHFYSVKLFFFFIRFHNLPNLWGF